jgi:hypothetical protein
MQGPSGLVVPLKPFGRLIGLIIRCGGADSTGYTFSSNALVEWNLSAFGTSAPLRPLLYGDLASCAYRPVLRRANRMPSTREYRVELIRHDLNQTAKETHSGDLVSRLRSSAQTDFEV